MSSMNMTDIVELLDKTSLFLGYHGAAFDNLVFLPRVSIMHISPLRSLLRQLHYNLLLHTVALTQFIQG